MVRDYIDRLEVAGKAFLLGLYAIGSLLVAKVLDGAGRISAELSS